MPDHAEVAKGTLRSLMRAAGLTVAEPAPPENGISDGGELWVAVDLESGSVGLYFH